jgi:hypothetical protein
MRSVDEHADSTTPAARARATTRFEYLRMRPKLAGKSGSKHPRCPACLVGFNELVGGISLHTTT